MAEAPEREPVDLPPPRGGLRALRRMLPRLNGLQARMALIMGPLLIPAVVYCIWQAFSAYGMHTARLADTIRSTAELVSVYETDFFERTRALLQQLAATSEDRLADPGSCAATIAPVSERWLEYDAVTVLDAEGFAICSSRGPNAGQNVSVADRRWFQRLKTGEDGYTVSELLLSRVTGERAIVAAAPRYAEDGRTFEGVVAVSIDLSVLTPGTRALSMPAGSVLVLLDESDRPVLPRSAPDALQQAMPDAEQLRWATGSFIGEGRDGVQRIYAVAEIAWGRLRVLIGMPTGGSLSWLREELVAGVLAPTLILVLALVAMWMATNRLVNRHIHMLAQAARAYSAGHLETRPRLEGAPAELAYLGRMFAVMADHIAERETELKASLAQKEILLREIHHRVKNNLQIVTSLLNLRLRAIRAPAVRRALEEVQTRIKALALVHRNLYEQDQVGTIELQRFLSELGQLLIDGADPSTGAIELEVKVAPTRVVTEKAMAIALLVTECVSNALKHAFPDGRDGTIRVTLDSDGSTARLSIADDGVGMPAEGEAVTASGEPGRGEPLGLTLCRMLAKQIGGELELIQGPGTEFAVTFSVEQKP